MKVKVFYFGNMPSGGKTGDQVEQAVNAWFAENPDLKIHSVHQSHAGGDHHHTITISVFYEDAVK